MQGSLFRKESYKGGKLIIKFKCCDCGCENVYRHKKHYGLSFLEGHFHCLQCKKEVDYTSDDFYTEEIKKPFQLKLF